MPKYFGTDGIRARAGQFPLTEDFVVKLGYCALLELQKHGDAQNRAKTVIIAEDSRQSGPQLSRWLSRGINAAGFDVLHIGIAPTPAVAFLTHKKNAVCGIVISASHNPAEFNGIKFFSHTGKKLNEDIESLIETAVENTAQIPESAPPAKVIKDAAPLREYIDFLKSTVPAGVSFKALKRCLTAPMARVIKPRRRFSGSWALKP